MTKPTPLDTAKRIIELDQEPENLMILCQAFIAQDVELKELRKERDEARKVISFYSRGGGLRLNFKTKMLESSDSQDKNPFYGSLAREFLARFPNEKGKV